jgi:hypothetical protein
MGRPLNKKFFGNRNIGTNGYTPVPGGNTGGDDGIGGEGVASYGTIVAGSGWTATPTVTFSPPDIPGGVNVAGTAHYQALSATVAVAGTTAYPTGTPVTQTGGASFTVATLAAPVTLTVTAIGTSANLTYNTTTLPIAVGTSVLVGGTDTASCGLALSTYYISASPAPTATSCTLTDSFANAVAGTNTLGATTARTPPTGLTFTARSGTAPAGIVATVTKTAGGDYTTFTATPTATNNTVSATGLTLNVTYGLLSIAVTQKGSGYTSPADAAVAFGGSTGAAATAVLTTDSGAVGSATNQENAIIIHAKTTTIGTVKIGDIQEQVGSRRYRVKTSDGVAVCKLVASNSPAAGEAYILATDHTGASYWVTKLTAHRATVIPRGDGTPDFAPIGTGYNSEVQAQHVGWTFGTAQAPSGLALGSVKIENA